MLTIRDYAITIRPIPLLLTLDATKWSVLGFVVSGRRDSNSQPSAWQADALPIVLLPHCLFYWDYRNLTKSTTIQESLQPFKKSMFSIPSLIPTRPQISHIDSSTASSYSDHKVPRTAEVRRGWDSNPRE